MSPFEKNLSCREIAPLLVFYVCKEVSEDERELIEAHLAKCQACAGQLAEEKEFQSALEATPQPADKLDASGILLSQCRSELEEVLDDLSAPPLQEHWRPFGWLRRWMALRPAWSAALLILVGALTGIQILPRLQRNPSDTGQAMNVHAPQTFNADQYPNMVISGLDVSPSPGSDSPNVQVEFKAQQPMVLSGNVENGDMRRLLTYVLQNGERFDAGVRLDCLEALKAAARDLQVRAALLNAARKDENPAVRMKAVEALRNQAGEEEVRKMLLEALERDNNPGVRVEAVNVLVGSLDEETPVAAPAQPEGSETAPPEAESRASGSEDPSFDRVVRVLQQLQHSDPSPYVRLRSAAALRQIGPREVH
jgi:hypothetical protein